MLLVGYAAICYDVDNIQLVLEDKMKNKITNCNQKISTLQTENNGILPSFAWPGGYPIFYLDEGNNVLCPECTKDNDDFSEPLVEYAVNWESTNLYCNHCSERIESAYAED